MKSLEFLRNFRGNNPKKFSGISCGKIPEKFSETSRAIVSYSVPQKIRKIGDQILRISQKLPEKYSEEFLRIFSEKVPDKFSGISRDYVTYSVPSKLRKIGDKVLNISQEFPEKYS